MDELWKDALWNQFGAAMDMFGNALEACPDELWTEHMWNDTFQEGNFTQFWYVAYHALFFLDLYLEGTDEGFQPPAPFDLNELDPNGLLPAKQFSKEELLTYLKRSRNKCRSIIQGLTDEKIQQSYVFPWRKQGVSFPELQLYNMRHLQEHGAQLSMFIGQRTSISARWVGKARDDE